MAKLDVNYDPRNGVIEAGLHAIGTSVPWLMTQLSKEGRTLHPECSLAKSLSALEDVRNRAVSGERYSFASGAEAQQWYLRASGADFLSKALHRGALSGLQGFDSMFRHLAGGDPVLTGPTRKSDKDRNVAWEFLLASLVASFSTRVVNAEPDIICEYEGQRVGIAAKVLYSGDAGTHLDRVKEGARQLERSEADCGFVVLNMVQLFPHARMFANFNRSGIRTNDDAIDIIDGWGKAFMDGYELSSWARRLKDMRKLLCVMFFVPTVLHLHDSRNPLVPYYGMHLVSIAGREEKARSFAHALNWSCQTVLSFQTPLAAG